MIRSFRMKYLTAFLLAALLALLAWSCGRQSPNPQAKYSSDLCATHSVVDSLCSRCHPDLIPMFKARLDWCVEHNLPESQCDLCHPELRKNNAAGHEGHDHGDAETADWCAPHRVPESQCTRCGPHRVAMFKARGDWCAGHDVPESHCYLCNPGLKFPQEPAAVKTTLEVPSLPRELPTSIGRINSAVCATDEKVVQLASSGTADRIGLQVEAAREAASAPEIEAVGEVEFDATASYAVTSLVPGTLVRWVVNVGDEVSRGQTLAYLESLEGVALKSELAHASAAFDLANIDFERRQSLFEGGMISQKEFQDAQAGRLRAQAERQKATNALRAIGYTESELQSMLKEDGSAWLPIRARTSGVLAEQRAALGEVLTEGSSIGLIAEKGKLWVEARVRERDLVRVSVGQQVMLSADGDGFGRTGGVVTWVSESVDPATRMGRVRIQPRMNGEPLYAHQFVNIRISAGPGAAAVLVPRDAVQWEGCCNVVFVAETPDRFRPRKVHVLFSDGSHYAVAGVRSGEHIVTRGSYLLKTELMKEGLGVGCCGVGA